MTETGRVGFNGIGPIGKFSLDYLHRTDAEIVGINDVLHIEAAAQRLRADPIHSRYVRNVNAINGNLHMEGRVIPYTQHADPSDIPFAKHAHVMIEATGHYANTRAIAHVINGAEHVVVSAPVDNNLFANLVYGINHTDFDPEQDAYISNLSCTTKAVALPLHVLLSHYDALLDFERIRLHTVHATTSLAQHEQAYADGMGNGLLVGTGAAKALEKLFPHNMGTVNGSATRIPVRDGSIAYVYATVRGLSDEFDTEQFNELMAQAVDDPRFYGRIGYQTEPVEHADADIRSLVGRTEDAIILPSSTEVVRSVAQDGNFSRWEIDFASFYDNQRAPAENLGKLVEFMLEKKGLDV